MTFGLFLGSGASTMFGFPTSDEILSKIEYISKPQRKILVNLSPSKDIEELLANNEKIYDAVKKLSEIDTLFNSFNINYNFDHENDKPHEKGIITQRMITLATFSNTIPEFQSDILELLSEEFSKDKISTNILEKTYKPLFDFLIKNQKHIDIFTTNYDSVIEEFALKFDDKYRYDEGMNDMGKITCNFSHNHPNTLKTCKLHGSLDWIFYGSNKKEALKIIQKESKQNSINEKLTKALIPPVLGKTIKNHEFFGSFYNHYKSHLEYNNNLIIIGYSFRDKDISDLILERIKDDKKVTFVISPNADRDICVNLFNYDKNSTDSYISQTCQKLKDKYQNLFVIKRKFISDTANDLIKYLEDNFLHEDDYFNKLKLDVWQKGNIIKGQNSDEYRLDAFNNKMKYDVYEIASDEGWFMERIIAKNKDGFDELSNFRPLTIKSTTNKLYQGKIHTAKYPDLSKMIPNFSL